MMRLNGKLTNLLFGRNLSNDYDERNEKFKVGNS